MINQFKVFLKKLSKYLIIFISGFAFGAIFSSAIYLKFSLNKKEEITSTSVYNLIKNESFLITAAVYQNIETNIKAENGSKWSDALWGHEIHAEALVQTDIGIDFASISQNNIRVDNKKKIIEIELPDPKIYNSSIVNGIDIKTTSGILKKLFKNDPGKDFEISEKEILKIAESSVLNDTIKKQSKENAKKLLEKIFSKSEYKVSIKNF